MTLVRDLLQLPQTVSKGQFVVQLTDGIAQPEALLRDYAITPDLAAMLAARQGKPNDLVWRWDREYHSLWPSLKLLCKRAGVRGTGFHRMRKASASYVALGGGDATEHLGHANPEMTRAHYLDPRITSPKTALDYLPPLDLGGGPGKPR